MFDHSIFVLHDQLNEKILFLNESKIIQVVHYILKITLDHLMIKIILDIDHMHIHIYDEFLLLINLIVQNYLIKFLVDNDDDDIENKLIVNQQMK